jgi:hypothetical protein
MRLRSTTEDDSLAPDLAPFDGNELRQRLMRAVGRIMEPMGFRGFWNAGIPKFERREDEWIQELVLRVRDCRGELGVPVQISIAQSNTAVQSLRANYWHPAVDAPSRVGSGRLGELELPPVPDTWWFLPNQGVPNELTHAIESLAAP